VDDRAEELGRLARDGGTDPRPLLGVRPVFGDLGGDPAFVAAVAAFLRQFDQLGVRATVQAALDLPAGTRHDADDPSSGRRTGDLRGRVLPTAGTRATAGESLLPA
jgi:fructuronate reductase/mannitol 2-dehydrogenase